MCYIPSIRDICGDFKMKDKENITTKFKIAYLEEIIRINDFDFNEVPSVLIEYYIELKLKDLI